MAGELAGDDPDLVIFYNLRQLMRELGAIEKTLAITAEHDAGDYLRVAAERAQDIRTLVYPVYHAMLKDREKARSGGDGG